MPAASRSSCTATAPPASDPLVALEAVKLGIRIVNTGIPPLADGSALPSIFNVAHNLRALGYKPVINEEVLRPVTEHFNTIAKREGFPLGVPAEYDEATYQHQVPGGMISNLGHQLRQVGKEAQLADRRWRRRAACASSSAIRSWSRRSRSSSAARRRSTSSSASATRR